MRQVNNDFGRLSNEEIHLILKKYNIEIPDNFIFSDINIIVGTNGSGKTRLLRAVRELYRATGENKVMYGYFPHLSHSRKDIVPTNDLPLCTLYESLQENEIEFEDFLKEVELHNEEYIPQLLTYHSYLQKERGEKALKTLQDTFLAISGQEILFEKGVVYIKDRNSNISPLKDIIMRFSPGELMIFYMSVFLSLQKNSNKKRVIILDEPECHLHPKALLEFVRLLKESKYFTSVWIATHSLFLLPDFDFQSIIYVDDSKVCYRSSKLYKDIFEKLLGDDIDKTTQFIASLSQWQYSEYIAECFTNPDVIDTINPEDEQVKLFINFLETHKTIRVLDFGGGSARLGLSLKESDNKRVKQITYEIYDPFPRYTGKDFVIHKSLETVREKYDCIVMMNVLHEIEPKDWIDVFKNIYDLLNDNSYLLFVETSVLNKGEMPNKTGFLVLGIEELKILFSCSNSLSQIVIKEGQKSVCVPIPKEVLKNITNLSICATIDSLEKKSLNNLITERKKANFDTSRYYAFLTQQYINAKIFNETDQILTLQQQSDKTKVNRKINIKNFSNSYKYVSSDKISPMLVKNLQKTTIPISKKAYTILNMGLNDLCQGIEMKREDLNMIWREILLLEKNHADKYVISLLLLCLYVLGDKRSNNRIFNNGYQKNVEKIISSICKE